MFLKCPLNPYDKQCSRAAAVMDSLSCAETLALLQDGNEDLTLAFHSPLTKLTPFWESFDLGPAHCLH